MKLVHAADLDPRPVTEQGAANATVRWLLSRPEGAPHFAMRLFDLAPGGYTPSHEHAWEHEVYMLAGEVEVVSEGGVRPVRPGDAVLVLPDERHQFRNTSARPARFLCLIPLPE